MKPYHFPNLLQSHPQIIQSALQAGQLTDGNMTILIPEDFDFGNEPPKPITRGAGDIVARIAQPIARMIDGVFKTDIQQCGGCKARQEKLNEIFPSK